MYSDLFQGIGRYGLFDAVKENIRDATDGLARLCASRLGADYVFIATEQLHGIEIFGRYGHEIDHISLSSGIRNRLGRRDPFIYIPRISDEPRLKNHAVFQSIGCDEGSLVSMAASARLGSGRTGIGYLTKKLTPPPSESERQFLQELVNSAACYIGSFLSAELMEQQKTATWQNIDALSETIGEASVGVAIFHPDGTMVQRNRYWNELSHEVSHRFPRVEGVQERLQPYIPDLVISKALNQSSETLGQQCLLEESAEVQGLIQEILSGKDRFGSRSTTITYYDLQGDIFENTVGLLAYPVIDSAGVIQYVSLLCHKQHISDANYSSIGYQSRGLEVNRQGTEATLITNFLASSLRAVRRSLWRDDSEYSICRTWRASVKAMQIEAIGMLKSSPASSIVDLAAREIAALAVRKYGSEIASVVPVPCGHSPADRCLSKLIAQAVAKILDVPFIEAFPHSGLTEASGRHKAAKVPKDPALQTSLVPSPALLVDDVATTGTHLSRYSQALRSRSITTYSIAWIGYVEPNGRGKEKPSAARDPI